MSTQIGLFAADGYHLTATKFPAEGTCRGHLVMAGATGIPQGFYRRFAEYCSRQGYTTLTLDYRGIGLSKPRTLKGFHMNYLDWATLDLAAAVAHMASPDQPLYMVGHSFGGHAFGLLPNHHLVKAFYTFGTGAGWHGWMPWAESLKVQFMWRYVLTPLTRWKGYSPWSLLGIGEDLPLGVFDQWKHWCQFPNYFFDDPTMTQIVAKFAAVRTPIVAANALDDLWASPSSRDAFMKGYTQAPLQKLDIDPARNGAIGHMGYFRAQAQPLWADALDWFQQDRQ